MREVTGPVIATTLVLSRGVRAGSLSARVPPGCCINSLRSPSRSRCLSRAIVALTLTPALSAILIKPTSGEPNVFFRAFNTALDRLTDLYAVGVRMTLKGVTISLLLIAGMLFATYTLFRVIPGSFVPAEDQGYLFAAVILPDGASLDRSQALTQEGGRDLCRTPGRGRLFGPGRLQPDRRPVQDQFRHGIRFAQGFRGAAGPVDEARVIVRVSQTQTGCPDRGRCHSDQSTLDPGPGYPGGLRVLDSEPWPGRCDAPVRGNQGRDCQGRCTR